MCQISNVKDDIFTINETSFENENKYSSKFQKFPQLSKISADNVRASTPFSMSEWF